MGRNSNNHKVKNCYHATKPKCTICKWIGHEAKNCRFKKKTQKPQKDKNNIVTNVTSTKGEAHIAEIGSEEETLMACDAENPTLYDNPFFEDISDPNVYTNVTTNESAHMYDWLVDSGSINHITNWREFYSSYEPMPEATVHGVGGKISQVAGQGTILLIVISALATQAWPYCFCQELTPFVAHDGGPCMCYQCFG